MTDQSVNSASLSFVDNGVDLVESLRLLGRDGNAWLQATGWVEAVELRGAVENADTVTTLRGRFSLLTLGGARSGPFFVTLGRATDVGMEVVGGELLRARSLGVTVFVQSVRRDVGARDAEARDAEARDAAPKTAERTVATPSTGSASASTVSTSSSSGGMAPSSTAPTWAKAAVASASAAARAREDASSADQITPDAGDLVEHFAFGVCEVVTSDGERLRIRDLDGPKRVREVALTMLRVTGPTDSDGKRLFQLTRRTPA